jgi:hypothetical protein
MTLYICNIRQNLRRHFFYIKLGPKTEAGLSSLGVLGVPWHTQILADQLTLFQPGGTDYAHLITTGTPGISDLPTALQKSIFNNQVEILFL